MRDESNPAESFLLSLPRFALAGKDAYKPGLERMTRLLEQLGNPHLAYPSIHIAGTNGKGSTASMISAIASAAGIRTGLHTSPHLMHVGERMRIDGNPAPPLWIDQAVRQDEGLFRDSGASFFEVTTALSFKYFAECGVDLAVVEVGLGGRFDATNVLIPELSVLTGVALDHEDILGSTIELIAAEKAGIIKTGVPVVCAAMQPSVIDVFSEAARSSSASFHLLDTEVEMHVDPRGLAQIRTVQRNYDDLLIDLPGEHQIRNAATAIRAVEVCSTTSGVDDSSVRAGIAHTRKLAGLHGRMERLFADANTFVDVAHNADSIIASITTCEALSGRIDRLFIGLMADKGTEEIARWLAPLGLRVSTLLVDSDRAMDPDELARRLQTWGVRVESERMTASEALDQIAANRQWSNVNLFLGSHLVVAEAMTWAEARTCPDCSE